ncbi:hypothetical protein GGTG_14046 [Gaeumannomyces tritici R3-111a-1]|uniref:Uncharacterized protein n=1 Tax=Gaeumannomyces tritici (strain R3-111a-1) TaxID=644352 RepID=J3PKJ0_GAET3|nr:hypothetical protein GGTG_14046 [Gaeumannomyces tritici R3-111a-1]EJT68376.1 hypothetical protein GGTG_14046 [Gaeumannomyces tritici R3-111a-1]
MAPPPSRTHIHGVASAGWWHITNDPAISLVKCQIAARWCHAARSAVRPGWCPLIDCEQTLRSAPGAANHRRRAFTSGKKDSCTTH